MLFIMEVQGSILYPKTEHHDNIFVVLLSPSRKFSDIHINMQQIWGEMKMYTVLVGKLKERDQLGGIGVNDGIVLKWIWCEVDACRSGWGPVVGFVTTTMNLWVSQTTEEGVLDEMNDC
jgi:hypothetical protein